MQTKTKLKTIRKLFQDCQITIWYNNNAYRQSAPTNTLVNFNRHNDILPLDYFDDYYVTSISTYNSGCAIFIKQPQGDTNA